MLKVTFSKFFMHFEMFYDDFDLDVTFFNLTSLTPILTWDVKY